MAKGPSATVIKARAKSGFNPTEDLHPAPRQVASSGRIFLEYSHYPAATPTSVAPAFPGVINLKKMESLTLTTPLRTCPAISRSLEAWWDVLGEPLHADTLRVLAAAPALSETRTVLRDLASRAGGVVTESFVEHLQEKLRDSLDTSSYYYGPVTTEVTTADGEMRMRIREGHVYYGHRTAPETTFAHAAALLLVNFSAPETRRSSGLLGLESA